jgi:hypothetical protein
MVLAFTAGGCAERQPEAGSRVARPVVAEAPEAGVMAIAGPVPATVRVLYTRNGGMALARQLRLPAGAIVRDLSLSADGTDLLIATDTIAYAASTRTGRIAPVARAATSQRPGRKS